MPCSNVPLTPKVPGGPLRVLIIGRISTPSQDIENIAASYRDVEAFLSRIYQGPLHVKRLGEQGSGMRTDRATIREAEDEIATGTWDVVIAEDLARSYRNPRYQYAFVQDAVDHDTRVICYGDSLDTADENWEVALGAAALRHGLHIPDTRRRVKRTATHAFHRGGMVMKVRFGYRKLSREEADSGQFGPTGLRIARLPEWTDTIREMARRVREGVAYAAVADWLRDDDVPPGPYVEGGWSAKVVEGLLSDPILSGTRTHRDELCTTVFGTGKPRRRKNAGGPETEHYPELAHLTPEEHRATLAVMAERAAAKRSKSGSGHPLYNKPRSRVLWPAQHPRCAACGGLMHRYDDDHLKCSNTTRPGAGACWNRVQMPCRLTRDRVLAWVVGHCERYPEFRRAMGDAAWAEIQARRSRQERRHEVIDQEIAELEKRTANLAKAIALGGELDALVKELEKAEKALKAARGRREGPDEGEEPCRQIRTRADVDAHLEEALHRVASESYEFAELMRRIIPEFVIRPVQALDSGHVRPRAVLLHRAAEDAAPDELADALELPEFLFAFDPARPPVWEPTFAESEWRSAASTIDGLLAYPAWMFARRPDQRWETHPIDGTTSPFPASDPGMPEGTVAGSWVVRDGLATPLAQEPLAIYAALGPHRGRAIRNPAHEVLRGHGLIPARPGYRAWREAMESPSAEVGGPSPPGDDATAAGRFRRSLESYVTADLDGRGRSARLESLLRGMRSTCEAMGIPLPGGRGEAREFLVALLDRPWEPAWSPSAGRVQVIRLSGPAGPGTLAFSNGAVTADLADLGRAGRRYEPAPPGVVRAALHRRGGDWKCPSAVSRRSTA